MSQELVGVAVAVLWDRLECAVDRLVQAEVEQETEMAPVGTP